MSVNSVQGKFSEGVKVLMREKLYNNLSCHGWKSWYLNNLRKQLETIAVKMIRTNDIKHKLIASRRIFIGKSILMRIEYFYGNGHQVFSQHFYHLLTVNDTSAPSFL